MSTIKTTKKENAQHASDGYTWAAKLDFAKPAMLLKAGAMDKNGLHPQIGQDHIGGANNAVER